MPTDDVGGVEARGSGEGICLRRSLHDHYTRHAALDSSPDDEQHELPSAGAPRKVRYPVGYVEDELQQEGLEYSAGTRSRTGRAGPRVAGKQARAQRTHDALAHGLARGADLLPRHNSGGENQGPCKQKNV